MAAETILVQNTFPRIQTIGVRVGKEVEEIKDLKLMPGTNEVDAALWKEAKKIKVVRHKLEDEEFLEMTGTTLADLKGTKAKEVIRDTFDRDLLKKWLDMEKRPGIQAAIQEQLASVQPDGKPPVDQRQTLRK